MTKHTQGPYTATIALPGRVALIRALDSIAGMQNTGDYTAEEFEANARLLAASATMFKLIDRFIEWRAKSDGNGLPPGVEGDDYLNGDDGRTDDEDGWHDLDMIVSTAAVLRKHIEDGTPLPEDLK